MSDIKYIIVSDVQGEEGEQPGCCTRRPFPCLAVLRYVSAGVVAVLAVTVISMVIRAMLRSEDIRLFVNNGYIGADSLWTSEVMLQPNVGTGHPKTKTWTTEAAAQAQLTGVPQDPTDDSEAAQIIGVDADSGADDAASVTQTSHHAQLMPNVGGDYPGYAGEATPITRSKGCYLGCSGGSGSSTNFYNPPPSPPATEVTLRPPTVTNLRVILVINNPGGRSKIDCNDTVVTISDAANPNRKIAMQQLRDFTVPEQTTITLQKRVRINDTAVLNYIWDRYGRRPTFGVVVRVSSSVVSYPLGKMTEPKRQTYWCRSVTLGLVQDEASFANQVDCTAENDKEPKTAPPAAAPTLAPALAPAH